MTVHRELYTSNPASDTDIPKNKRTDVELVERSFCLPPSASTGAVSGLDRLVRFVVAWCEARQSARWQAVLVWVRFRCR